MYPSRPRDLLPGDLVLQTAPPKRGPALVVGQPGDECLVDARGELKIKVHVDIRFPGFFAHNLLRLCAIVVYVLGRAARINRYIALASVDHCLFTLILLIIALQVYVGQQQADRRLSPL